MKRLQNGFMAAVAPPFAPNTGECTPYLALQGWT